MKHSVISWDCCFRNFFHLVQGLAEQDYPRNNYELIYVEQRTREAADAYNHAFGLKSLSDLKSEYSNRLNFRVLYLNDPPSAPFHLGRCNNAGIAEAKGEIISVMDGDQLLASNFLTSLDAAHARGPAVVNLHRLMCRWPVGVYRFSDWMRQKVAIERCRSAAGWPVSLAGESGNRGPLISARRSYWEDTGGYDPGPIWVTSANTSGEDVNQRLEIATGAPTTTLHDTYAVHPWHPAGYARQGRENHVNDVLQLIARQRAIASLSRKTGLAHWRDRESEAQSIYRENRALVQRVVDQECALADSGLAIPKGLSNWIPIVWARTTFRDRFVRPIYHFWSRRLRRCLLGLLHCCGV